MWRVESSAGVGGKFCGGLWLGIGVDEGPLLVPLVTSPDGSCDKAKGVVVVGAWSTKPRINSGTEDGVTLSTIVKDGRSRTVVGRSCVGRSW